MDAVTTAQDAANLTPGRFRVGEFVRWSDIDLAGIICYGAYVRFFEIAETELFRAIGFPFSKLFEEFDFWLPRAQLHFEFRKPALLDDHLDVEIWVAKVGTSSLRLQFEMRKGNAGARADRRGVRGAGGGGAGRPAADPAAAGVRRGAGSLPGALIRVAQRRRNRAVSTFPSSVLAVLETVGEAGDGAEAGADAAAAEEQGGIDRPLVVVAVDHRHLEVADRGADVVRLDDDLAARRRVRVVARRISPRTPCLTMFEASSETTIASSWRAGRPCRSAGRSAAPGWPPRWRRCAPGWGRRGSRPASPPRHCRITRPSASVPAQPRYTSAVSLRASCECWCTTSCSVSRR